MNNYLEKSVSHGNRLLQMALQKSSSQEETKRTYAQAYINACNAVRLDTEAKYTEARAAYKSVIKVIHSQFCYAHIHTHTQTYKYTPSLSLTNKKSQCCRTFLNYSSVKKAHC